MVILVILVEQDIERKSLQLKRQMFMIVLALALQSLGGRLYSL